ncbi:CHASE domain-containing protein [Psychrosphaera sp. F3M07]|uniref:CHASE domain-containing protein n=1 Tax=Psychrosphaera sp. F3M07 TaxID=2841560 RepID=UPI001C0A3487|nr:CHASE domain-containing protein [Psychrosphaera sp. F3M07]MBU2918524.1 CHASE domain-containing protein [Psychrosphaera sp. F3M07]
MKQILLVIFSFCLHFVLVKFGSLFTLPFGYASIVWPVTGVILGMYFLFGRWILIGALLSSLLAFYQDSHLAFLPNYLTASLAVINIIQLVFTKYLIVRLCKLPININKPYNTIKFLILTGPFSSFIFSVIFFVILWFGTALELEVLMYICTVKWVGEFFGIVFLTPIFLFLYKNDFVRRTRRGKAAIITSVFSFILITSLYLVVSNIDYKEKQLNFINTTEPFIEQFNITQTKIKHHIKSLDGLFQASSYIGRSEFELFTNKINSDDTKIRALAWLPHITHEQRDEFEQSLKNEGVTNAQISQLTNLGMITALKQPYYLPVFYIEPMQENQSAIGLDVSTHPVVSESVMKAIHNKNYAISPLLSLAQQQDKLSGIIVYYPIYIKNEIGIEQFTGLVEVIFEIDVLLSDIYKQLGEGNFTYQLSYDDNNNLFKQESHHEDSIFTYSFDITMFDKNGSLTFDSTTEFEYKLINWAHLSIMVVGLIIGVICVMFVFFIVSFNSNLTRKVTESTAELLKKNDELEAANQAKNLFLANISHEYRTPLNAIMGFTEIAKRETTDEVAKQYLAKIDNASDILLNIVNDVLDLTKMQAGEMALESIAFQPSAVTTSVVEMFNSKAKEKSISLTCDFAPSYDLWVQGDELRFKQIIINLLNNAIKFTDNGGVSIWGECIDNVDRTRTLLLKVIDTGIGIKPEDQERLFSSFAQAESATTRKYGGTGLGLSIVKQLCGLMGGDIQLTSDVAKGSEFTVKLNLPKSVPLSKESRAGQQLGSSKTGAIKDMNVLVVEDNKINQTIVQKQLVSLGARCDLADDGQQALNYLKHNTPDLILMDIQMPVMDGFTASTKIKQDLRLQHIPIVILSASVGKEDRDKASSLGIVDFIYKPFKQADLFKALSKYSTIDKI